MFNVVENPPQEKILAVPIIVINIIIISINIIIISFFFLTFIIVCYRHTACLNISAALYLTTQKESSLGQYKLEVSDKKNLYKCISFVLLSG